MANFVNALPFDPRWKRAVELPRIAEEKSSNSLQIPVVNHLLLNGLARGALMEASGARSSGKTSICVHILAQAARVEKCARWWICTTVFIPIRR